MTIKIKYLFLILSLLVPLGTRAQEVQEYPVMDFSGGLVNSISNSLMKDNQALILENYDIDPWGNLHRRPGLGYHYITHGRTNHALAAYYLDESKQLLMIQANTGYFDDDTANVYIGLLSVCNNSEATCTTNIYPGFYLGTRDTRYREPIISTIDKENLIIASIKSEMLVYDGNYAFPARPYAPSQIRIGVIEGGGNITARVKYKYIITSAADQSNASAPSWEYKVSNGKVYLYGIGPVNDTTHSPMQIRIYRSDNRGPYVNITSFTVLADSTYDYLDTTGSLVSGDTLSPSYGEDRDCDCDRDTTWPNNYCSTGVNSTDIIPPGGFYVEFDSLGTTDGQRGIFSFLPRDSSGVKCDSINQPVISYSVVFVDSAGRESYSTPVVCYRYPGIVEEEGPFDDWITRLHRIPTQRDSTIRKKYLLRRITGAVYYTDTSIDDTGYFTGWDYTHPSLGSWYILDSLDLDAISYIDSGRNHSIDSIHVENRLWCDKLTSTYISDSAGIDSSEIDISPEQNCYDDSVITFQPLDIAMYNSRAFAIGHPVHKNYLYFSDFGRPTTFPYDKFISIPSAYGDWFVRLVPYQNILLLFRQNSIYQFSGASFYQFNVQPIVFDIGLSSPHAIIYSRGRLFFAHKSGIYQFPTISQALSFPIKNTIDSAFDYMYNAVGRAVDDEFWFSLPVGDSFNTHTYIYSEVPAPHWKSYSFGIRDAVAYDRDTLETDFSVGKYVIASTNDTLYEWGYPSSASASADGFDTISAIYQSKYFFEDENREKIHYVDIIGSGRCSTLTLTFFGNYSTDFSTYDTLGTKTLDVDFSSLERWRFKVNNICKNFSVRIQDIGLGDYRIKGYVIGWQPWDKRKVRP